MPTLRSISRALLLAPKKLLGGSAEHNPLQPSIGLPQRFIPVQPESPMHRATARRPRPNRRKPENVRDTNLERNMAEPALRVLGEERAECRKTASACPDQLMANSRQNAGSPGRMPEADRPDTPDPTSGRLPALPSLPGLTIARWSSAAKSHFLRNLVVWPRYNPRSPAGCVVRPECRGVAGRPRVT